jgi:hypothetical protein
MRHAADLMADASTSEASDNISIRNHNDQMGCARQEADRRIAPEMGHSGGMLVPPSSQEDRSSLPRIDGNASGEKIDVAILSAERLDRLSLRDRAQEQPVSARQSRPDSDAKAYAPQPPARLRGRSVSPCASVASSRCSTVSQAAFSNPRQRFLLFVKILFKCLTQANEPEVLKKAKKIVAECARKNREGDPKFVPLMEAVEKRLRGFVGEVHWRRSILLLRHYIIKKNSAEPNKIESS